MCHQVSPNALRAAIEAYLELSEHEFTIILPRKGTDPKIDVIDLVFRPENFSHFLGLHYLTDKNIKNPKVSKELFDKFRRKAKTHQRLDLVTEFNEFVIFNYDRKQCDVEKRLNLVSNLHQQLVTFSEKHQYQRYKSKNLVAAKNNRHIAFDFAIELSHQLPHYNRIFFFMAKDKFSVNPIAYNPVSIIEQSDDYLEGHIVQSLALFEHKRVISRNSYPNQKKISY